MDFPLMRIRPYIPDKDYEYLSKWIDDERTHAFLLKDITAKDYSVIGITLTCSEETLRERHKKRGDANECSFFWLHLKPYESDCVINTDNKSVRHPLSCKIITAYAVNCLVTEATVHFCPLKRQLPGIIWRHRRPSPLRKDAGYFHPEPL